MQHLKKAGDTLALDCFKGIVEVRLSPFARRRVRVRSAGTRWAAGACFPAHLPKAYSPRIRESPFSATYLWQPSQVCNFPCVGICHLSNKRASLKEAKRDVNRGFDCFSYFEQGQQKRP